VLYENKKYYALPAHFAGRKKTWTHFFGSERAVSRLRAVQFVYRQELGKL
jgi:hypothetical protein